MFVSKGDALPSLVLTKDDGTTLRLPEDAGGAPWVIFLPRSAACAKGREQARALGSDADIYESLGIRILVLVEEDVAAATALREGLELPFPVATSPGAHKALGLERKLLGMVQESGTVLVAGDGHVVYAHKSTMPSGALDEGALMKAGRELVRRRRA